MRFRTMIAMAAVGLALALAACGGKEKYGVLDSSAPAVQVKDVILGEAFNGKDVRMTGTIAMQCASTGCWFFLDDGTGRMLIDLKGLGLGLPQRSGKKARVSGTVTVDQYGQPVLSAKGLEVS